MTTEELNIIISVIKEDAEAQLEGMAKREWAAWRSGTAKKNKGWKKSRPLGDFM